MIQDTDESKYKVGQVWSYKNRPQDSNSAFAVVKVESAPGYGNIVHISITGLRVKNPREPQGYSDFISHMPFSEDAIDKSVGKLLMDRAELPDYREGYETWRREFDAGEAGVFTISVAEGVEVMEKVLNP